MTISCKYGWFLQFPQPRVKMNFLPVLSKPPLRPVLSAYFKYLLPPPLPLGPQEIKMARLVIFVLHHRICVQSGATRSILSRTTQQSMCAQSPPSHMCLEAPVRRDPWTRILWLKRAGLLFWLLHCFSSMLVLSASRLPSWVHSQYSLWLPLPSIQLPSWPSYLPLSSLFPFSWMHDNQGELSVHNLHPPEQEPHEGSSILDALLSTSRGATDGSRTWQYDQEHQRPQLWVVLGTERILRQKNL